MIGCLLLHLVDYYHHHYHPFLFFITDVVADGVFVVRL